MRKRSSTSVRVFYPKWSREDILSLLAQRLPQLEASLPLLRVVLFGSCARGRATVASDVDLLVIYRGARREDAYALVKQTLGIPRLEPHVHAEKEYQAIRETVDRMARDGIPVFP